MTSKSKIITRFQSRKFGENPTRLNNYSKRKSSKSAVSVLDGENVDVSSSGIYNSRSFPLKQESDGSHKTSKPVPKTASLAKQRRTLRDRSKNCKGHDEVLCTQRPVQQTTFTEVHMRSANRASRIRKREDQTDESDVLNTESDLEELIDGCASSAAMETDSTSYLEMTAPWIPDSSIIIDIDARRDPLTTSVYAKSIMDYLMEIESRDLPMPGFLNNSPEVTSRMRGLLMDWLLQVQNHEELKDETLHCCVAYTDKFLSLVEVKMSELQLIGITCLFIASKFNERFSPEVSTLCYLTDNTFVKEQVIKCERVVLQTLHFNLAHPVAVTFLDRYLQIHNQPSQVEYLARYLLDLQITSLNLASLLPSMKASSALYLARLLLLDVTPAWTPSLVYYTNYTAEELQDCTNEFIALLSKAPSSKLQGARSKYSAENYMCISHCDYVKSQGMIPKKFRLLHPVEFRLT